MAGLRENLAMLETIGLIFRQQDEPELAYAFNHIFTQESVYQSLLQSERRRLHQQIGEALEELYFTPGFPTDRGREELAPVLAYLRPANIRNRPGILPTGVDDFAVR